MCLENDKKAEIMSRLCELAWTSFHRRRSFEWKFSLAIWTPLAAFISIALKDGKNVAQKHKQVFLVGSIGIFLLYTFFHFMIKFANDADKAVAIFHEKNLLEFTGKPFDTKVLKEIKWVSWCKGYYGMVTQIGITALLIVIAILVVF